MQRQRPKRFSLYFLSMTGLFGLTIAFACLPASESVGDCLAPRVMDSQSLGSLYIGENASDLLERCSVLSDSVELDSEAMPMRFLRLELDGDTVLVEIDSGRVWRIQLTSRAMRTARGFGVGTTLDTLLAVGLTRSLMAEGAIFVTTVQDCGISYELSAAISSNIVAAGISTEILAKLPKDTFVRRALVHGCNAST